MVASAVGPLYEEVGAVRGPGGSDEPLVLGVYVSGVDGLHVLLEREHGGSRDVARVEHGHVDVVQADGVVEGHRGVAVDNERG